MTKLVVNGVAYERPEHTTFAQDIYLMERVRAAGLDKLQVGAHETAQAFVDRLQTELTPVMLPILAGMLVPVGEKWTDEGASRTLASLGATIDPKEKASLRSLSATLLAHFFATGIASATTSRKSSGSEPVPSPSPSGNKKPPRKSGARARTATGQALSA